MGKQKIPWKRIFKKHPLVKNNKLNPELIVYLSDTYGIPIELGEKWMRELLTTLYKIKEIQAKENK